MGIENEAGVNLIGGLIAEDGVSSQRWPCQDMRPGGREGRSLAVCVSIEEASSEKFRCFEALWLIGLNGDRSAVSRFRGVLAWDERAVSLEGDRAG